MFIFFSVDIIPANICFLRRRGKRWRRELWSLTVKKNIIWKEGSHGHDGHASPFLLSFSPSLTPLWRYIQTVFDNDRPLYLFLPLWTEKQERKTRFYLSVVDIVVGGEGRRCQVAARSDDDRLARIQDVVGCLNEDVGSAYDGVLRPTVTSTPTSSTTGRIVWKMHITLENKIH